MDVIASVTQVGGHRPRAAAIAAGVDQPLDLRGVGDGGIVFDGDAFRSRVRLGLEDPLGLAQLIFDAEVVQFLEQPPHLKRGCFGLHCGCPIHDWHLTKTCIGWHHCAG